MVDNSWETIEKHLACFWEQKECFPFTKPNIIYVEGKSGEGKANDFHNFTIAFHLIYNILYSINWKMHKISISSIMVKIANHFKITIVLNI